MARSSRTRGNKTEEKTSTGRSRYRGAAGRQQASEERERIKERRAQSKAAGNMPFRYWMPPETDRKVIVLDAEPDFYRYEHALLNPDTGRNDLYTDCINEFDTCPVCEETDSRPYYAMYLTVIDMEEYTNKNDEIVPWTRKLFVVKSGMQRAWVREYEKAERAGESLRGRVFTIFRDGDKDPVTGNQIEEDMEEDIYSDEELSEFTRSWTDREKKTHTEDCSISYDYDQIMPETSGEELGSMVGGRATPGSRRAEEEELTGGRGDRPSRGDSSRRSRRGNSDDEESTNERADDSSNWEEPDDSDPPFDADTPEEGADDKEEEAPTRGRRGAKGRGRAARQETEEAQNEEETEEETEEEEKPSRRTTGRRSRR